MDTDIVNSRVGCLILMGGCNLIAADDRQPVCLILIIIDLKVSYYINKQYVRRGILCFLYVVSVKIENNLITPRS